MPPTGGVHAVTHGQRGRAYSLPSKSTGSGRILGGTLSSGSPRGQGAHRLRAGTGRSSSRPEHFVIGGVFTGPRPAPPVLAYPGRDLSHQRICLFGCVEKIHSIGPVVSAWRLSNSVRIDQAADVFSVEVSRVSPLYWCCWDQRTASGAARPVSANMAPTTYHPGRPQVMQSAMSRPGPRASASPAPKPNTPRYWPVACVGARAKDTSKPAAACHSSPTVWITTAMMSRAAAAHAGIPADREISEQAMRKATSARR